MEVIIEQTDGGVVAVLKGRLDTAAAAEVADAFGHVEAQADKLVTLDCKELEYISSSGLRLLLTLRKAATAKGGRLLLRQLTDQVRGVFALTGFDRLFEFSE